MVVLGPDVIVTVLVSVTEDASVLLDVELENDPVSIVVDDAVFESAAEEAVLVLVDAEPEYVLVRFAAILLLVIEGVVFVVICEDNV